MILKVSDLYVSFDKNVLKGISFEIPKGKILAVVGGSGSGKTVTGLTVMGLIKWYNGKIDSGEIIFEGKDKTADIIKLSEKELEKIRGKEISMIFQNPQSSLNPIMKVGKQLEEVLKNDNTKMSREDIQIKISEVFKSVGLTDTERICNSYPFELSGGMCQRVMISISILSSPSLLIADEPTTFLDRETEVQILGILKNINRERKMSIMFITHNLQAASEIADMIAVMHNGEIVEIGETEKVFNYPEHPYTKRLIDSMY